MKILITGILSGLGKYIYENLGGIGLTRDSSIHEIKNTYFDVIIHCAFNSSREVNSNILYDYLKDNVFLTKELVFYHYKKFIFFSSVDVYPKTDDLHSEDEIIKLEYVKGIYGITKLMSESIIKNYCKNYLILRGVSFLGKYSRKNSLIKILENKECVLSLSDNSIFNYVLYSDILAFVRFSLDNDLKGIYNLASSENITLFEVADMLGKKVKFGRYFYNVGNINNSKISSVFPVFKKTSKEVIIQFIKEWKK